MTVQVEILSPDENATVSNVFRILGRAQCSEGDAIVYVGPSFSCIPPWWARVERGALTHCQVISRALEPDGWTSFTLELGWPGPLHSGSKPTRGFSIMAWCDKGHVGTTHRVFQTEVV